MYYIDEFYLNPHYTFINKFLSFAAELLRAERRMNGQDESSSFP